MNILLINHHAGSPEYGMEFRPYYMCREWLKAGHQVLIVGASYSHLRKLQPQSRQEKIDGVNYRWIHTATYKGNGVGRIVSMGQFVGKLYANYKKYLSDFTPDIVIASSTYPLDIYPAKRIARHYKSKLIYEVHDLWPLSPMELGGYSANHPFIRVMQKAEDDCYKYVDAVVSMLPKSEEHMRKRGLKEGKFNCVPNGIVLDDWKNTPPHLPEQHSELLRKLREERNFIVGFTGAHGIANSLYAAIDAAETVAKDGVALVLTGTGPEKEKLIAYAEKRQVKNVYFLPAISKQAIPALLERMDALYIGLQKQPLFKYGISPNKLFDYMMAAKPVIQAIDAGNNIVVEAHCGICTEPDNREEIGQAMLTLKNMTAEERQVLGDNGRAYILKHHTYQVLARRFLDVMEEIRKE